MSSANHWRALRNAAAQDRVILADGALVQGGRTIWTVLSTDTIELTTDLRHVLGKTSLEFDKTDGDANTVFAGIENTVEEFNLSRFLGSDLLQAAFSVSSVTDIAEVNIRLGTDSSNYNEWTLDDSGISTGVWQTISARLDSCALAVAGDGWDPQKVTYVAFIVEFDAQDKALADIYLDHIIVKSAIAAS